MYSSIFLDHVADDGGGKGDLFGHMTKPKRIILCGKTFVINLISDIFFTVCELKMKWYALFSDKE